MRLLAAETMMLLLLNLLSSSWCQKESGEFHEVEALLALKEGFNNPIALASWNRNFSKAVCHRWRGVTCQNNSFAVTSIVLRKTFRGGIIAPAIGDLPFLQAIDLSNNFLGGIIPPEINRLNSLIYLDLSRNLLSGSIPANWNRLTQLTKLNLRLNQLNGAIPPGLSGASSLQYLRVENNSLVGEIPPQIGFLRKLRYLAIEHNDITGALPEEIGLLPGLRSVYAAYNQLNGSLPESIVNLTRLLHFEVEGNQLSGTVPALFGSLTKSLRTLNLSNNNFSGQVPISLSKFNTSAFANNRYLCGFPLPNCTSPQPRLPPVVTAPQPPRNPPQSGTPSGRKAKIVGGTVVILSLLILVALIRRRRAGPEANWFSPEFQANIRKGKLQIFGLPDFGYAYKEIVSYAGFFDTAHILGKGRFAKVYRSSLPDGTELAVKVLNSTNVSANFEKEIVTMSSIRHPYILPIRGLYCNPYEKAIFYDYMPRGTLYELLHSPGTHPSSLPDWAARQRIAFGVAQALSHLHRGCPFRFCHRDVKSTNILLNSDLSPRLSDIGLTQLVSSRPQESTAVLETPGYTAPEVLITKKYSEKADVYSFGVVLMELLTGKEAVYYIGEKALNLKDWVTRLYSEKRGREMLDTVAYQTCPFPEYMDKALDLAVACVGADPIIRPSMFEVAGHLEGLASNPSPLRSPDFRDDKGLLPYESGSGFRFQGGPV